MQCGVGERPKGVIAHGLWKYPRLHREPKGRQLAHLARHNLRPCEGSCIIRGGDVEVHGEVVSLPSPGSQRLRDPPGLSVVLIYLRQPDQL